MQSIKIIPYQFMNVAVILCSRSDIMSGRSLLILRIIMLILLVPTPQENIDGSIDVLNWRDAGGEPEIWFKGSLRVYVYLCNQIIRYLSLGNNSQ